VRDPSHCTAGLVTDGNLWDNLVSSRHLYLWDIFVRKTSVSSTRTISLAESLVCGTQTSVVGECYVRPLGDWAGNAYI